MSVVCMLYYVEDCLGFVAISLEVASGWFIEASWYKFCVCVCVMVFSLLVAKIVKYAK